MSFAIGTPVCSFGRCNAPALRHQPAKGSNQHRQVLEARCQAHLDARKAISIDRSSAIVTQSRINAENERIAAFNKVRTDRAAAHEALIEGILKLALG